MSSKHVIGELIVRVPMSSTSIAEMIVATSRANTDPLHSADSNCDAYPWVYYVLSSHGKIIGPLFSAELISVAVPTR